MSKIPYYAVFLAIVMLIVFLCWPMASSVSPKVVLAIDSYILAGNKAVSIGNNSDVCYQSLPENFMRIKFEGKNIHWEIPDSIEKTNGTKNITDTLRYFKICDENPNRYSIENSDSCVIQVGEVQIKGSEIYKIWDSLCYKQQYVLARNLVGVSKNISIKDDTNIRSFFYRERGGSFLSTLFSKIIQNEKVTGGISLIILDRRTSIGGQHYKFSGNINIEGKECAFKFQFFDLADAMLQPENPEKGLIAINDVHYTLKPVVVPTAWGAGHIMLRPQKGKNGINGVKVCFPKSNMYVGDIRNMTTASLETSNTISLKQRTDAYPTAYDIYIPQISKQLPTDICLFKYDVQTPNHIQIIGENDSIVVSDARHVSYAPLLTKKSLSYGNDTLQIRAGTIDSTFLLSYLAFPFTIAIVLLFWVCLPRVGLFNENIVDNNTFCKEKVKDYPVYALALFSIFFVYAICKVFIALKLSYTYPFFEKLTGITSTSIALIFILFVSLLAHLNFHVFKAGNRKSWYGYVFITVLLLLWIGSAYYFISIIDTNINYALLESYFRKDFDPLSNHSLLNPMTWKDKSAILDNHRNTVYGLIMMTAFSILVLYVRCMSNAARRAFLVIAGLLVCLLSIKIGMFSVSIGILIIIAMISLGLYKLWLPQFINALYHIRDYIKRTNAFIWIAKRWRSISQTAVKLLRTLVQTIVGIIDKVKKHWVTFCHEGKTKAPGLHYICTKVIPVIHEYVLKPIFVFLLIPLIRAIVRLWFWHYIILITIIISGQLSNFSTAFITFFVVLGLSSALSKVEIYGSWKSRIQGGIEMIWISIAYVIAAFWGDHGYMTNYIGFVLAVIAFYFLSCKEDIVGVTHEKTKECAAVIFMLAVIAGTMIFVLPSLVDRIWGSKDVDYGRTARRIQMYSDFGMQREKGYRYTESDAEFMAIMSHYMVKGNSESHDPLSNEENFLHPSVSTGQSPVVLNDLSVPIAFFGCYGIKAKFLYLSLIILLLILVISYNTKYVGQFPVVGMDGGKTVHPFPREMRWCLLAVFMWVGTSFYLYLSYSGWLPFTGRLNPGMGVDSMGEALESAILMAYMASVTIKD